jgi:hypothetical protein
MNYKVLRRFLIAKPFNLIANNLIWIGCVIGREQTIWLIGPAVIVYVAILVNTQTVKFYQIAIPAMIGISVDSVLTLLGIYQFENTSLILPLWLIILWIAFSTTLTSSLHMLGKNKIIAVAIGSIGMPINYLAGERLGAVYFGQSHLVTISLLCILWAICLPLLYHATEFSFGRARK